MYPLLYLIASSVSKSTLGIPFQEFVGGDNFAQAMSDSTFTGGLIRTTVFSITTAVFQVGLGLCIALLMRQLTRGQNVIRTIILLPLLTPPVMAAVVWKLVLAPNGGLLNAILTQLGIIDAPLSLLGSPVWAIVMVGLADTWQWTPFVALLLYAGLLALPGSVYEAAQVEGASPLQTFRHITLPLIMPSLTSVLLIKVIISFKIFDLVYVLTAGGPADASMLSGFLIFRTALREFDVGYASAQTLLFVVIVTAVTIPVSILRKKTRWAE
ncbi:carbohydrate ABC transporter permease [Paramicrobacterium fandaimingii]|uniref:carbohydrate ABC transporter permease n=1 Tax=Paramicrobacterium fandaimingii TaxID=2708079 RepID=UPI00141F25AD|nr:sugar ABC transporter permease [Microbacterium fandaimingii]